MLSSVDEKIVSQITSLREHDEDYWSFSRRSKRTHCHGFIKYPAMMVPEMQGELIDILLQHQPGITSLFDPFVGSGTTMGEAMMRGLDFQGVDINPLAILACETKSDVFYISSLEEKIFDLEQRLIGDKSDIVEVDFPKIDKWFISRVQVELSKIRRAIVAEPSKWARRFFWVAFSDTVRGGCNSRTSTYKLHMKPQNELDKVVCCFELFRNKIKTNFELKKEQMKLLGSKGLLSRSSLLSDVELSISNIKNSPRKSDFNRHDMLITSPPYGDNPTTVPYGQFSYLPLMWIDTADLRNKVPSKLLENASAIDTASLGGSHKGSIKGVEQLRSMSQSFSASMDILSKYQNNSSERLFSFVRDLNCSLDNMLFRIKSNGYLVWTLGNRHMSGQKIPLNSILKELLEVRDCQFVIEIDRIIPFKRMASRNSSSQTMNEEQILIMRKG